MDTTLDGLLNRRVMLEQPTFGYRIAIDTVLLAAAVTAETGDRVLDLGCGVGGAMLSLAARMPGVSLHGIDIQEQLIEICRRNIERNKLEASLDVVLGDGLTHSLNGFDHVMMNPPYHEEIHHDVSADLSKRTANTEKEGDLKIWIKSAAQALKSEGTLTLIHRADRLDEILKHTNELFGQISSLLVLPKEGEKPKRVIVRAQKGHEKSHMSCQPLVLHKVGGGYTEVTEDILRHLKALTFKKK